MRTALLVLAVIVAPVGSASPSRLPTVRVSGRATQTGSYCGGVAPTPEMLRHASTPHPLVVPFLIRPGTTNRQVSEVARFTPDPDGRFQIALPPGVYCVVRAEKAWLSPTSRVLPRYQDARCMAQWRRSCDAVWQVGSSPLDGSFTIPQPCFGPCYRGPMPP